MKLLIAYEKGETEAVLAVAAALGVAAYEADSLDFPGQRGVPPGQWARLAPAGAKPVQQMIVYPA